MIKVTDLGAENSYYLKPEVRAKMMARAALDYFRACSLLNEHQWQKDGLPFFNVLPPTMHQTLELASKAIALLSQQDFNPKKYSHQTLAVMKECVSHAPVFVSILDSEQNTGLIAALEASYTKVRYGESHVGYDEDMWSRFVSISAALFNDLHDRTGLNFPMAHRISHENG